jgi:hypothetical protein
MDGWITLFFSPIITLSFGLGEKISSFLLQWSLAFAISRQFYFPHFNLPFLWELARG